MLQDEKIDITCDNCGKKITTKIGQLKGKDKITCRCGTVFVVESKQALTKLREIDKTLDGLF